MLRDSSYRKNVRRDARSRVQDQDQAHLFDAQRGESTWQQDKGVELDGRVNGQL